MRPAYLSQKLDRPLPTKDGGTLRTIRDACGYMTGMGKKRELLTHWQGVAKLILAQADVVRVSRALELALFMDAKLDVPRCWRNDHPDPQARHSEPAIRGVGR